jgi:hypothetical protein
MPSAAPTGPRRTVKDDFVGDVRRQAKASPKRTGRDPHTDRPDPYDLSVPKGTKASGVSAGRDYGAVVSPTGAKAAPAPKAKAPAPEAKAPAPEAKAPAPKAKAPAPKAKAPPRTKFSAEDRKAIESAGARARATQQANQAANAKFEAAKSRGSSRRATQAAARKQLIGI